MIRAHRRCQGQPLPRPVLPQVASRGHFAGVRWSTFGKTREQAPVLLGAADLVLSAIGDVEPVVDPVSLARFTDVARVHRSRRRDDVAKFLRRLAERVRFCTS